MLKTQIDTVASICPDVKFDLLLLHCWQSFFGIGNKVVTKVDRRFQIIGGVFDGNDSSKSTMAKQALVEHDAF